MYRGELRGTPLVRGTNRPEERGAVSSEVVLASEKERAEGELASQRVNGRAGTHEQKELATDVSERARPSLRGPAIGRAKRDRGASEARQERGTSDNNRTK